MKNCIFCQMVDNHPPNFITENEECFSVADRVPNAKGHILIISKKHRPHLSELKKEEWKSIFPLVRDSIGRIRKLYNPVGFNLMTVKVIGQEIDHFHLHIIPKYKKDYGHVWMRREKLIPSSKDYKEVEKILGVTQGIVAEKGEIIARLVSKDQSLDKGHINIKRKKYLPNEIDEIDLKTWMEAGELLQECIQKTEKGIGSRGFQVQIPLGKMTGIEQESVSEFQIHLIPRKEIDWSERRWVPEYQRIAEKLRNAGMISNSQKHSHEMNCSFCGIAEAVVSDPKEGPGAWDRYSNVVSENEKFYSLTNRVPNAKGHLLVITKRAATDLSELTEEEWSSLLPFIKECISRLKICFPHTMGYHVVTVKGKELSKQHFHLHIIPKWKKGYGPYWMRRENWCPSFQEYQESKEKLEIRSGMIEENSAATAKLADFHRSIAKGHSIISPKKPIPNDIEVVDQETWNQMGSLLRCCIEKYEKGWKNGEGFRVQFSLGRHTGIEEEDFSEFQIHFMPIFGELKGRKWVAEYKRIAEKLRNPDKYAKKLKITEREREYLKAACYLFSFC